MSKIRKVIDKMKELKNVIVSAQNRLTVGLIFVGLGGGLISSAYLRVPK